MSRTSIRLVALLAGALAVTGCATGNSALEAPPSVAPGKSLGPAEREAAMATAQSALIEERWAVAEAGFTSVLAADSANAAASLGLGETYLATGRVAEAAAAFAAAAAAPGLRPRALQGRGLALLMAQRRDEAVADLRAALDADPLLWRAWNGLGLTYAKAGNWADAETCYRNARARNGISAIVENNLGYAYLAQRRYADAHNQFTRALQIDSAFKLARNNQRLALAGLGRYSQALAGAATNELPQILNDIGVIAMERGDHVAAQAHFTQAMEASPSYHAVAAQNLAKLRTLASARPPAAAGAGDKRDAPGADPGGVPGANR
jgi:Flp pilus assembly protein TadD